ncbi:MAG: LysR family transcriptional regulator [Oscillospiraceae bacterium]
MNTVHLQYIIEIERTRSISQAAENLFVGQPNLSRILHEMEKSVGFCIFERSSKGARPTERGAVFLQHAKSILRELEQIDALGPRNPVPNRLRVCIPRAAALFDATAAYLARLEQQSLDAVIRECHARTALELMANGEAEIGVIRFRAEYRDYFEEQSKSRGLNVQILSRYRYQLVMHRSHPLAQKPSIARADLAGMPEIVHGDNFRIAGKSEEAQRRRIYSVDRMSQVTLLESIPGAYLWSSPVPPDTLARWDLVQRRCGENPTIYHDALLYHPHYSMTEIESGFVQMVQQLYAESKDI